MMVAAPQIPLFLSFTNALSILVFFFFFFFLIFNFGNSETIHFI